jgi:hypothetical protein
LSWYGHCIYRRLEEIHETNEEADMSRWRWVGGSVAIFLILVLVLVVVTSRRTSGSPTLRAEAGGADDWATYIAAVDRALEARDLGLANRQWRDGYGAALRSQRWEAMLAAGETALRIGRASRTPAAMEADARQCFLTALFRARAQRSVDGILLTAEAFAQLGDIAVAEGALRMADPLVVATSDGARAWERVAAVRDRLEARRDPSFLPEE